MSLETYLGDISQPLNVVIQMGSYYFARKNPDSGLVVPDDFLIVRDARISPSTVDIRSVKTTLENISFSVLDKDGFFTSLMGAQANGFLGSFATIFIGYKNGSFPWADYEEYGSGNVTNISKEANGYKLTLRVINNKLNNDFFNWYSTLTASLSNSETGFMELASVDLFEDSGQVKIDEEFILYSGRDIPNKKLTGLIRGNFSTTPESHNQDAQVFRVDTIQSNPIDILLRTMISPGGGGTYDTLTQGLGISSSLIDVARIEYIRDTYFSGDVFRFHFFDTGNALKFYESEILEATNTRFISKNGLISLSILDQTIPGDVYPEINEQSLVGNPQWSIDLDRIINQIQVNFNYDPGSDKFTKTLFFENASSISTYNKKSLITLNFKGIKSDLNGVSIINNRVNRYLARLSTPQISIKLKTFFKNSIFAIGDKVNLVHRYLPQPGGSLGMSADLEILSKGIDLSSASTDLSLQFTSSLNLRRGLICPSPFIISVVDQKTFEVPNGSHYGVGYTISIDGEIRNIASISGNFLTVTTDFVTILSTSKRVKFPNYNLVTSGIQKAKYRWIGLPNGANFSDGSKYYIIDF